MNIESYVLNRTTFLILPSGATPPDHIDLTHAKLFKRLTLVRGETPRIGLDANQVLDDLESQGWAVIGAAVRTHGRKP